MTSRTLATVSVALGAVGVALAAFMWIGTVTWEHAPTLVVVLLFASVSALGWVVLATIQSIRKDLILVRDRSKSLVDNTTRTAERTEEVRRELLLGTYSHIPGQIARMESRIGSEPLPSHPHPNPISTPTTVAEAFDEVFVLNLDQDTEKMKRTAELLDRHDIAFTRYPAVDGNNPEFDEEWAAYVAEGPQLPPENYTGVRLIESRGAWGYLKSMQSLLEHAMSRELRRILLLEDDIMLHKEFAARFAEAWSELPQEWRLVYLGSAQADPSTITRYSEHLYHPGAMANGSYAVALDASMYDQALASIARFDWPFDAGALREIDTAFPSSVFAVDLPLVIADVSESGIRSGRALDAHADKHGWDLTTYSNGASL